MQCGTLAKSVIWETRMITEKKIIAENTNNYYDFYTEIIFYTCVTTYTPSPTKST